MPLIPLPDGGRNPSTSGPATRTTSAGGIPPGLNPAYLDSSYLSFLRQLGLDQTQSQAEIARRIGNLTQQGIDAQPVYADRLKQGLRDIGKGYEQNGQYQSGDRLQAQNEFQVGETRSQLAGQNDIANSIDTASLSLAKQIANGRVSSAEEQLAAKQRVKISGAELGIR